MINILGNIGAGFSAYTPPPHVINFPVATISVTPKEPQLLYDTIITFPVTTINVTGNEPTLADSINFTPVTINVTANPPDINDYAYRQTYEQGGPGHLAGDLLRAFKGDYLTDGTLVPIYDIEATVETIPTEGKSDIVLRNGKATYEDYEKNHYGLNFVQVGSTSNENRRCFWERKAVGENIPYDALFKDIDGWTAYDERFDVTKDKLVSFSGDLSKLTGLDMTGPGTYRKGNHYFEGSVKITGGTARTEIDAKANTSSLKAMAYEDKVESAKLGTSIFIGGYIKTELLDVDDIFSKNITATGVITGPTIVGADIKTVADFGTGTNQGVRVQGTKVSFYRYYAGDHAGAEGSLQLAGLGSTSAERCLSSNVPFQAPTLIEGDHELSWYYLRKEDGFTGTHDGMIYVNGQATEVA